MNCNIHKLAPKNLHVRKKDVTVERAPNNLKEWIVLIRKLSSSQANWKICNCRTLFILQHKPNAKNQLPQQMREIFYLTFSHTSHTSSIIKWGTKTPTKTQPIIWSSKLNWFTFQKSNQSHIRRMLTILQAAFSWVGHMESRTTNYNHNGATLTL